MLDIYDPASGAAVAPVVVFFYGGGWTSRDRAIYRFVARSLSACGVLVIIPDYRVGPEAAFPGFLQDTVAAVAQARPMAPGHSGDPACLFLMGHSAGAYIAAMLALDPIWVAEAGMGTRDTLAGVLGIAEPCDFLPLKDPVLQQIFEPSGPNTQPISFAQNATMPFLLMTGTSAVRVDPCTSQRLATRVRMKGGQAEARLYPGLGNVAVLKVIAAPLWFLGPVREDTCQFLGVPPPGRSAATFSARLAQLGQKMAYQR